MERVRKFVGKACYLTPCIREDAENWYRWLNDPEVAVTAGRAAFRPPSIEDAIKSYEAANRPEVHAFTICALEDDEPIGRCWLEAVDPLNRRAWLNIYIGSKRHWGRGYGEDAIRLLLDYGFTLLNLRTILLDTIEFNERAIRCYAKAGFREMGRWRKSRLIDGTAYDLVFMDILAEEFDGTTVRESVVRTIGSAGRRAAD